MILHKKLNQKGVVSFITVIFLAGILTLVTTGFVKVMISNQRQSLDNQLSTQAFYAAESAINDVKSKIATNYTGISAMFNTNKCGDIIGYLNSATPQISNDLETSIPTRYSCLMVNDLNGPSPLSPIEFALEKDKSQFYQLKSHNGAIVRIKINWGSKDQSVLSTDGVALLPLAQWRSDKPPILRVTLYYPGGNLLRTNLVSSQRTFYIFPTTNNSNIVHADQDGSKTAVGCTNGIDYGCEALIELNNGPDGMGVLGIGNVQDGLYIRVMPMYTTSSAQIRAFGGLGAERTLENAQYTIDATGRANDVYKRIRVTLNMNQYPVPEEVVESGNNICKQFMAWPAHQVDEAPKTNPGDMLGCSLNSN